MNEPRQAQFAQIGATGCYLLSIVHLVEDVLGIYVDAYMAYLTATKSGEDLFDCTLEKPAKLMSALTGQTWTERIEGAAYVPQSGEREILEYQTCETPPLHTHFVVGNGQGGVEWDPIGESQTVKNGRVVRKRIFKLA
jgi:hypothetical protein